MAGRQALIPVGEWVDLAAAVVPALVAGKSYSIEWEERTIGYLWLTYDDNPPSVATGIKVWARNDPRVPLAGFTVPEDGKIWLKAVEKDVVAKIVPADPEGDDSVAP